MPRLTFQDTFSRVQHTYWTEVAVEGHPHNALHAFHQNRRTSMDEKAVQAKSKDMGAFWILDNSWRSGFGLRVFQQEYLTIPFDFDYRSFDSSIITTVDSIWLLVAQFFDYCDFYYFPYKIDFVFICGYICK